MDDPPPRRPVTRRSVLRAGGATAVGLGTIPSLLTATARAAEHPSTGVSDRPGDRTGGRATDSTYEDQRIVSDESGSISLSIPADWDDVAETGAAAAPSILAAPDVGEFTTTWNVPGIEVILTTDLEGSPGATLDELTAYGDACADGGRHRTRLPDHEFLSQGWYQCNNGGATFLSMVGVPANAPDEESPVHESLIRDAAAGPPNDGTSPAPYTVIVGAQGVTGRDLGAISAAVHSLETETDADRSGVGSPLAATEAAARPSSGETVRGAIGSDSASRTYAFDDARAGDRLRVEVTRTGGQGLQAFYLLEPGTGPGFSSAIDAAVLGPYGANALTGDPGPVTLSGEARTTGPGHALAVLPGLFPAGTGPYEFRFDHEATRTERAASGR